MLSMTCQPPLTPTSFLQFLSLKKLEFYMTPPADVAATGRNWHDGTMTSTWNITVTSHDRHGVSLNQQQPLLFVQHLFMLRTIETSWSCSLSSLCPPMIPATKGQVPWKAFPCHDVIMKSRPNKHQIITLWIPPNITRSGCLFTGFIRSAKMIPMP